MRDHQESYAVSQKLIISSRCALKEKQIERTQTFNEKVKLSDNELRDQRETFENRLER